MKALILYRSYHGNTRQVADAIGQRLKEKGCEPVIQDVRQKLPDLSGFDLVLNGSPTRIKRPNGRSLRVLGKLKARGISSKPIAIFDTCAIIPTTPEELAKSGEWIIPGAAGILHKAAKDLGLNVFAETLRCEVKELNGPLVENAIPKALAFADALVAAHQGQ